MYILKKNNKNKGQQTNFWAEPRLSKALRVLWVDSIHPQLSIESMNAQFGARMKKKRSFEAEKGDFSIQCMQQPYKFWDFQYT